MIYAPIIIPTLSRYEHLKKCIESLADNEYAKYTDLFISVDFPPEEKYVEGYEKIKNYLSKGIDGFKNVCIHYQNYNLGPMGNSDFLLGLISEKYDRYIYTEDDNIFAPNYLEYMDKGLELFENNKDIFAIYATGPSVEGERPKNANVYLLKFFSAYGYGTWLDRTQEISRVVNRDYIENIACDKKTLKRMYDENSVTICALASAVLRKEKVYTLPDGRVPIIDMILMIYAIVENKYIVCSKEHMVKNNGYDGSGVNCGKEDAPFKGVVLSQERHFDYVIKDEINCCRLKVNRKISHRMRVLLAYIKIVLWRFLANRKLLAKSE